LSSASAWRPITGTRRDSDRSGKGTRHLLGALQDKGARVVNPRAKGEVSASSSAVVVSADTPPWASTWKPSDSVVRMGGSYEPPHRVAGSPERLKGLAAKARKGDAMRSNRFLVLLVGLCLVLAAATAGAEGWQRLGQRIVDYRTNPEVITVVGDPGAFAKLRLLVRESPLEILNVKVYVADGQTFDVTLNKYLGPGRETRAIEIPGGPKAIQKVEFTYKKGSEGSRLPVVQLQASN
jgi:hypothetical protein